MLPAQGTITATFKNGTLVASGNSPSIPRVPQDRSLVDYLSFLSWEGWRITRAVFEGFSLRLELEKAAEGASPAATMPVYLFHSFFISTFGLKPGLPPGSPAAPPGSLLPINHLDNAARDQKTLSEKFNQAIRADGWQELTTSKILRTTGYWILSLWMQEMPA